ncbi:hypothetical protein H0H87_012142, partial [Tephrocybe sp. NHM501043]
AEQALIDQNISIVPPMHPCVVATITTIAGVTAAPTLPVSVCPPISAHQHCLEAHTEHEAAMAGNVMAGDVKADLSNSDSTSSDDDTQSAHAQSHVPSDDSSVAGT